MAIDKAIDYVTRQMYKEGSMEPVEQAGVMNYMPSEMVTVPKIAKSSPNTPTAKLAYITPEEEDILVDLNLYGSLKGKPNKGPGGIPSLEGSFGDPEGRSDRAGKGFSDPSPSDVVGGKDVSGFTDRGTGDYRVSTRPQDKKTVLDYVQGKLGFQKGKKPGFFTGPGTITQRQQVYNLQRNINFINNAINQRKKKLLAGLNELNLNPSYDEEDETFADLMSKAPSIAGMTDRFSPETISDVLAGKRQIDFFTPVEGFSTFGTLANIVGPKMGGPVTKEKLMSLNTEIDKLQNIDPRDTTTKDLMKEFSPNQYDMVYGPPEREGEGGQQVYIPPRVTSDADDLEDDYYGEGGDPFENRRAYRFMNKGGIADTVVGGEFDFESARQMYGLGKLVKKVTRTVKKIAKSPIGKAALLYAGGTYLGGLKAFGGAGFGSGTFLSNLKTGQGIGNLIRFGSGKLFGNVAYDDALGTRTGGLFGNLSKGAKAGLGIAGISALAGLMTKGDEEDEDEEQYRGEGLDIEAIRANPFAFTPRRFAAEGGDIEKEPVAKKTMPLLDMGGKEMDLRDNGGFVPIGRMEKADDVPARLSKNEFVFTADAVRNAGDGDVDLGAEKMYNMMKNLEAGGDVSEESQGLEGARKMFETSQRLEEVI